MFENENIGESSHGIWEYYISRVGWGDFVLLGWNANLKTKTRPTCGTQLLAFNPRGAARIWQRLLGTTPGPWDNVLCDLLADVEDSAFLGMSYVYPAIGGYGVHISTATPTQNNPDVSWRRPTLSAAFQTDPFGGCCDRPFRRPLRRTLAASCETDPFGS